MGSDSSPFMPPDEPQTSFRIPHGGPFLTTHWSVIVRAGDSLSPERDKAMAQLCQSYWYPLYAFVRRRGRSHEDASDLTQGFFELLIEKHYLRSVDLNLGKFRTFLLTSMTHFLSNEWDKSQAARRGGGCQILPLDGMEAAERYRMEPVETDTPETLYERRWAQTLFAVVVNRLARETDEARFEVLKGFLLDDKGAVTYDEAAGRLGMSVPGVTSAIFRMRARFRALLFEEVAKTVVSPDEVEPELRHLLAALTK
jgi:DNA-directed RNA polymerase specialized sigma24 family protein